MIKDYVSTNVKHFSAWVRWNRFINFKVLNVIENLDSP